MTTWVHTSNDSDATRPTWNIGDIKDLVTSKDIDGNTYGTVFLDGKIWMTENLKTTKYNDGTAIPRETDNSNWTSLSTGARCEYNNDASSESDTYGYLYNWFAVNTGKLAPNGWRIPTSSDLSSLSTALGNNSGSQLASNAELWNDGALESDSGFNSSGFNGLPGGYRSISTGGFFAQGQWFYVWSSTEGNSTYAFASLVAAYNATTTSVSIKEKNHGYSIRCVADYRHNSDLPAAWSMLGRWGNNDDVEWESLDSFNWEDWG